MRDPDLSKAALITAEQILQEVCQQVLQKFNSFLNILISLDERQCIGILLLGRVWWYLAQMWSPEMG